MQVFFTSLLIIMSFHSYALTNIEAANIYSDMLLEEFDHQLDQKILLADDQSMMTSEVYARLLSARNYLEHSTGDVKSYLPLIDDTEVYNAVVAEINLTAEAILVQVQNEKSAELLIYPDSGKAGNVSGLRFPKDFWALTYDDGPRRGRTQKVVDEVYANGHVASFFMLMENVKLYPDTAQYVLDAGFELALHSYTHIDLSKATTAQLQREITTAKSEMEAVIKQPIVFFRLPYGAGLRKKVVRDVITKNKMIHVFWSVDSLDWKDKNSASIFERVKKQMRLARSRGGVILFHDIHSQTLGATKLLMTFFHQSSIHTCFLQDFLTYLNGQEQSCIK